VGDFLTEQYISVINNGELYKVNRALTSKEFFEMVQIENSAIANFSDSTKDILVEITEYDIRKNPDIVIKATKRHEIINKITERLDNLDLYTRDTYLVLFAHWFYNNIDKGMENEGNAYCNISDIHFKYRGLRGKNKDSTLTDEQYESYTTALDILANTRVSIDITRETNVIYDKIKSMGWTSIEGFLLNDVRFIYKEERLMGLWYNMGLIGQAYTEYIPSQISNKYPTALLKMNNKYPTAKNIGNYLCYLHQIKKEIGETTSAINIYNLMGESRYEIKPPNIQQGINRFIKNLNTVNELLIKSRIIESMYIPDDIHSKNYKDKQIDIEWIF
jgi:hypothetical protein